MSRSRKTEDEELLREVDKIYEGLDFTYIVDEIKGKELTEAQKAAKQAMRNVCKHNPEEFFKSEDN